ASIFPSVNVLSRATAYKEELAFSLFYFIATAPVFFAICNRLFRLKARARPLELGAIVLGGLCGLYMMIWGIDVSDDTIGFTGALRALLEKTWVGSSILFLLSCHLVVMTTIVLIKNWKIPNE
ncbi:MAG: hypothetical protein ACRETN_02560, partial [Nevskiales bacterium]